MYIGLNLTQTSFNHCLYFGAGATGKKTNLPSKQKSLKYLNITVICFLYS